jgi:hypothetical protein
MTGADFFARTCSANAPACCGRWQAEKKDGRRPFEGRAARGILTVTGQS